MSALVLATLVLSAGEPDAATLMRRARKLAENGDYAGAWLLAEQAVAKSPKDRNVAALAEAYQRRGMQALRAFPSLAPFIKSNFVEPDLPEITAEDRKELAPAPALQPDGTLKSFDLKEEPRKLIEKVAAGYGISVVYDFEYPPSGPPVKFHLSNADWSEAIYSLQLATGSFYVPVNAHLAMFAKETAVKRADLEPNIAISIPYPQTMSVQDLQEVATAVRQAFSLNKVAIDSAEHAMVLRDRWSRVRPAIEIARQLMNAQAEVMVTVDMYSIDVDSDLARGLSLPTSFAIVDFGPKIAPFLNNSAPPSGTTQFGTFGGGSTYIGVGLSDAQILDSLTRNYSDLLSHSTVRSVSGQPATLHIGDKYPIVQQTWNTGTTTGAGSYTPPPSYTFEDLGLSLKITPHVHGSSEVTLEITAEFEALSGNVTDGNPIINNTKLTATTRMRFGQEAVLAGLVQDQVNTTKTGIPLLSWIPGLSSQTITTNVQHVLLVLRPELMRSPPSASSTYSVWVGNEVRSAPLDFWDGAAARAAAIR